MTIEGLRQEILCAITEELNCTSSEIWFDVRERRRVGSVWVLKVEPATRRSSALGEALEGAAAWWPGPEKGGADILSVVRENQEIHLRYATADPPPEGGSLVVYPLRYLDALLGVWQDEGWAEKCLRWFTSISPAWPERGEVVEDPGFPELRERQRKAFHLPGCPTSFLWGPPGTGKTYTLGALLAAYLVQFPMRRVLLLSTTNSAVDMALVEVDKALSRIVRMRPEAEEIRRFIRRVGNHFVAGKYSGREHLLPSPDADLLKDLVALEAAKPDQHDAAAYGPWKTRVDVIRTHLKTKAAEVLAKAPLAAMTTTLAAFNFETLRNQPLYDLVVFDEASQVGLAHAVALAPLARRALFAGDPKQLGPVVQSEHLLADKWLGESIFQAMDEGNDSTCLLNEQSRMVDPICQVVSKVFYQGQLVVAKQRANDPAWIEERAIRPVPGIGQQAVHIQRHEGTGGFHPGFRGYVRESSARWICQTVRALLDDRVNPEHILVMSPFHAQNGLIRKLLRERQCAGVTVSTIHRSQGGEWHTVIVDPVDGGCTFYEDVGARRLVNVAISRAKARLILVLSREDCRNPIWDTIRRLVESVSATGLTRIEELVRGANFPDNAVNLTIQIGDLVGTVRAVVPDGTERWLVVADQYSGRTTRFSIPVLVERYRNAVEPDLLNQPLPPHRPVLRPVDPTANIYLEWQRELVEKYSLLASMNNWVIKATRQEVGFTDLHFERDGQALKIHISSQRGDQGAPPQNASANEFKYINVVHPQSAGGRPNGENRAVAALSEVPLCNTTALVLARDILRDAVAMWLGPHRDSLPQGRALESLLHQAPGFGDEDGLRRAIEVPETPHWHRLRSWLYSKINASLALQGIGVPPAGQAALPMQGDPPAIDRHAIASGRAIFGQFLPYAWLDTSGVRHELMLVNQEHEVRLQHRRDGAWADELVVVDLPVEYGEIVSQRFRQAAESTEGSHRDRLLIDWFFWVAEKMGQRRVL